MTREEGWAEGPRVTVTRPDEVGRPVELLQLGPDEPREVPRWLKRALAGVVVAVVGVSVGSSLLDRWQAHRLEQRQADALQLSPADVGGGSAGGEVQVTVGLRNDGPLPVRLKDPRLTAPGLEGIIGVTTPETVAAGESVQLVAAVKALCPPADLSASRVYVSVTAVADSGREQRLEVDVTTLPPLLEQACRQPTPADDLYVEAGEAVLVGDVLRVVVDLSTGGGGEGVLTGLASPVFARVVVRGGLPIDLPGAGTVAVEVELSRPVCGTAEPLPGTNRVGIQVPLDLVLKGTADTSGAGTGRGPRPDGADPDLDAGGLVVGRDLTSSEGASFEGSPAAARAAQLARLAETLVMRACPTS